MNNLYKTFVLSTTKIIVINLSKSFFYIDLIKNKSNNNEPDSMYKLKYILFNELYFIDYK